MRHYTTLHYTTQPVNIVSAIVPWLSMSVLVRVEDCFVSLKVLIVGVGCGVVVEVQVVWKGRADG